MKKDIEAFKKELGNYNYYKRNLEGTNELIEINEDLLSNLHGFDPSKKHFASSKVWVETDTFKRISDELDRLARKRDLRKAQIEHIESVLDCLTVEIRSACIEIYANGKSYNEISRKLFVSQTSLWRRINAELDEALK